MKRLSRVLLSSAAIAALTTSAYAAAGMKIVVNTPIGTGDAIPVEIKVADTAPVSVAYPLLKAGTEVDMNGTALINLNRERQIGMYTDSLRDDDRITFTIGCEGAVKEGAELSLLAWDNNNTTNGNNWVRVGTFAVASNTDADGNYKTFTVRMTEAGIEDNSSFFKFDGTYTAEVGPGHDIPSGTLLVLSEDSLRHDPITIVPNAGMPIGCAVKLIVDSVTDDGNTLQMSKPAPETIINSVCGLSAKVMNYNTPAAIAAGFATSVIDVADPILRKQFISENAGSDTPDTNTSTFTIRLTNEAEVGLDINGSADDKYTICVGRSNKDGVREVNATTTGDAPVGCAWDAGNSGYICTGNLEGPADGGDGSAATPFYYDTNVTFFTNATDVLQPGMWKVSYKVDADENGVDEMTLLSCANADLWSIDGVQFIIPYFYINADYGTYIVMTNMGETAADVYMDVVSDQGKNEGATGILYNNIQLASIPARSTKTYFPVTSSADIGLKEAILRDYPSYVGNRYLGRFTVTAQPNNIQAAAFQKDGPGTTSKRSIPVLFTEDGNEFRE